TADVDTLPLHAALPIYGLGKGACPVGGDDKGAGAADDPVGEFPLQVARTRPPGRAVAAQDRQPVDYDPRRQRRLTARLDARSVEVAAGIGRDVDDPAPAGDIVALDQVAPEQQRRADGIAPAGAA